MTVATLETPEIAYNSRPHGGGVHALPPVRSIRARDHEEWSLVGEPLRDRDLRDRVMAVLDAVSTVPGCDAVAVFDDRDFTSLAAALDSAGEQLTQCLSSGGDLVRRAAAAKIVATLSEVTRLRTELAEARATQKDERYAAVRSALSRLHGIESTQQMLERALAELCRCGFDRAIISRVEDSTWWVEGVHVKSDPEWASEIARVGQAHPLHIDHMVVESEVMRRRAPVLVRDAEHDPRINAAIGAASLSRSYVAAPIMPEGRVIGLLHADCYSSHRHVDDDDLAILWMFAEGFGYAYQRTVLSERLRHARNEIQRMARNVASAADDLCTARTTFGRSLSSSGGHNTAPPVAASLAADSPIESLLSRREIEVVSLMAEGKSNGAIATHLVIAEGTVKSHVKHILRKLKASNRAEAVFRYMRLTEVHGTGR
ncbi:LuxR C-terminal-related transcriptional regulator [Mycobacterium sp. NBC_00419]|uniref:LuxR C-terminal-related transcriptional regulator n=1 Tax=Mycobacterium sp. NBC_00419 TaxID=2975989 RepID=UPI002E238A5F